VVTIEGHRLELTNLDKVLYPEAGVTKAEVIHYYSQVAPVLLPHVAGRPVTLRRYPDGVDGPSFFEKNAARSAPPWVQTVDVPRHLGSSRGRSRKDRDEEDIHYVLICDRASLAWAGNLAALELHVPMWRATGAAGEAPADLMVFDLDPGAPATIVECCTVGLWLRDALADAGYRALPKTSGSKGLQLYVPLDPVRPAEESSAEAHRIAKELEREHPDAVVSNMRKDLRKGKVLIDWSQNSAAKTTVAPYSLRARPRPTVSTPVTWDEVEAGADGDNPLVFEHTDVLRRVEELGDLFAAAAGTPAQRQRSKPAASSGGRK
jgi:bifunctional non-homologous end joining protein LigD